MPKSSKKKKEKTADFSKAKLKLGKGKQQATNATDTSYKARSIALPTQSITVEKDDGEPTTKRNLTLDDLLTHMKHYNAATRKDAIFGLRELLSANPDLIIPSLSTLINGCTRIVGDDDVSVRKSMLGFLEWLFSRVPAVKLAPHTNILMLFITSSLSHIYPEIRIDAIRFLDIMLEFVPEVVVGGWVGWNVAGYSAADGNDHKDTQGSGSNGAQHGQRVLEGYLALLNLRSRQATSANDTAPASSLSSVVLSSTSKLILLKSLSSFLRISLSGSQDASESPSTEQAAWYLASSFSSGQAYRTFIQLLEPIRTASVHSSSCPKPTFVSWQPQVDPFGVQEFDGGEVFMETFELGDVHLAGLESWKLDELVGLESILESYQSVGAGALIIVADLACTLHPILLATFLDTAPTVFGPQSQTPSSGIQVLDVNVELVCAVGEIAKELYGAILRNSADLSADTRSTVSENLRGLLGHMSPYFPFGVDELYQRDLKSEQLLQGLNLSYCELTSLLVLASEASASLKGKAKAANEKLTAQAQRVAEYVVKALKGELVSISQPMGQALSAGAYTSLLPTIWSLINQPHGDPGQVRPLHDPNISRTVLQAALEHYSRTGFSSAVKKTAAEFIARLFLLQSEPQYQGFFRISSGTYGLEFTEWITSLPRTVWELGPGHPGASEVILLFLLRSLQRRFSFLKANWSTEVQKRFALYFNVDHPTRGHILGPFTKLTTPSLRRLALDVAVSFRGSSATETEEQDKLENAVQKAVTGTEVEAYWREIQASFASRL
ncbi:hypothetical protein BOTBODRAFT_27733 [Botryobasidium botryosum FD-172 SS1]|uniref:Pre-rRNA-processing protein n=1 Tax=Botryobasidium botryosum (strain FD-172 SS1) TaxID=930990 RepID=A0A067MX76_BOTB1|nr:hypothetical protein BOTBODRAFT_27733 [Botryobasidium botryosum FD-172 SS1]